MRRAQRAMRMTCGRARLAAALALALCTTAQAAGDLSGTWASSRAVPTLKTVQGTVPPLTAAGKALYQQHLAAARRGDRSWDPVVRCKPPGEPRTLTEQGWPFELMQSAHRIDFLFQWNRLDRSIEIADGSGGQKLDDLAPFYFGQSRGHWDGDTLVVNVIGLKDNTTLDTAGLPHSDDMELTERWRLTEGGAMLRVDIHVVDAAMYRRPWDTALTFRRQPAGTRIREDVCMERLHLQDYATLENSLQP